MSFDIYDSAEYENFEFPVANDVRNTLEYIGNCWNLPTNGRFEFNRAEVALKRFIRHIGFGDVGSLEEQLRQANADYEDLVAQNTALQDQVSKLSKPKVQSKKADVVVPDEVVADEQETITSDGSSTES